jgi:hypothetical protein
MHMYEGTKDQLHAFVSSVSAQFHVPAALPPIKEPLLPMFENEVVFTVNDVLNCKSCVTVQ